MNQEPSMDEVGPEPERLPPLHTRVLMVFTSPGRLFEALAREPAWAGALALGAVLACLSAVLAPTELFEESVRQSFAGSGQPVPDDLSGMATMARYFGGAAALIFSPLITALTTGILALVFVFAMGGEGKYRQYLAGTAHAFLVAGVSALALLPLKISAGDLQLRLSVGTFLPFLEEGWLASALGWLDLFALWSWVLVALAVSKIEPKRSWGSATAIILSLVVAITFGAAFLFAR